LFAISVVPHWDIASAVIEPAATAVGAFRRHAEIAMRLRDAGWTLAHRSR
jgi:hypothetical protein